MQNKTRRSSSSGAFLIHTAMQSAHASGTETPTALNPAVGAQSQITVRGRLLVFGCSFSLFSGRLLCILITGAKRHTHQAQLKLMSSDLAVDDYG